MNFFLKLQFLLLAVLLASVGCRSTADYEKKADDVAYFYISNTWSEVSAGTNTFTIERPSDTLRKKLFTEQQLISYTNNISSDKNFTNEIVFIPLGDAIQIAAQNNNDYQKTKEGIFETALTLRLEDHKFETSYQGMISALLSSSNPGGDDDSTGVKGSADAGFSKKFETGASLSGKLAFDLVKLLTLDKSSAYGLLADLSVSIPLLRGAGVDVNTESLTQAQRNLLYSLRSFVQYRQDFIFSVSRSYLNTIETKQKIVNAEENYKRINTSTERILSLADAGRMSANDVGQALQDRISSENSVIAAKNSYATQLDSLKMLIGLPPDAMIEIDERETVRLEELSKSKELIDLAFLEEDITTDLTYQSFSNRQDFLNIIDRVDDAERKVNLAANNLKADLTLDLGASVGESKGIGSSEDASFRIDEGSYSAILKMDLPWDRTSEMVAFRKSLINYDNSLYNLRDKEDNIKFEIRQDVRNIVELDKTLILQKEAVRIASNRVESTELFMQAGRVEVRDLLNAQNALFRAQDSLTSAVVSLYLSGMQLELDTGKLEVPENL
ncbi:MAG: TolC family protein [Kiritimatiellae bacterium]|jgi:outer membrane protein TolC|nr:TolC family protein [Kiritimatiellia bacterium]